MHERSLVRALLRQVQNLAAEHATSRVRQIRVRIGEFAGIEPDLLRSAYDDLVQNTEFHEAELKVDQVPLEAICQQCGQRFHVPEFHFQCPDCGSLRLTICGGEEMLLESVSMEERQS
jgi:hydrogenase nickel incorporation protein HypA/HybF